MDAPSLDASKIKEAITSAPLPVFSQSGHEALLHLQQPEVDVVTVQKILGYDPVLSLYVLKNANMLSKSRDVEITQVDHAISLLGLEKIKSIVNHLPKPKADPDDVAQVALMRAQVTSIHAAEQAYHWAKIKQHINPAEIYWASLLLGATHWALSYFLPEAMEMINHLTFSTDMPREAAEKEVLGQTVMDITRDYQEFWGLPQLCRNCLIAENFPSNRTIIALSSQNRPDDEMLQGRSARAWLNSPMLTIQLSNRLAFAANQSWYGKLMNRFMLVACKHLNRSLDEGTRLIHMAAVEASHKIPYDCTYVPAAGLVDTRLPELAEKQVFDPRKLTINREVEAQRKARIELAVTGNRDKPCVIYNTQLLDKVMTKWQRNPEQTANLAVLMREVLKAAESGFKAKRCMIGLLDQKRTHVKILYSFGYDNEQVKGMAPVKVSLFPMLVSLFKTPRSLEAREGDGKKLPAWPPLLQPMISKSYDLVSVFLQSKAVGFYYIDWDGAMPQAEQSQAHTLRTLGRASEYCIRHLARSRQQVVDQK